jgi:RNA polymerase sigma-70 factor, ECF subfamily
MSGEIPRQPMPADFDSVPVETLAQEEMVIDESVSTHLPVEEATEELPQLDPRIRILQSESADDLQKELALGGIIEEFTPALLKYIERRVHSHHTAEDVLQETFMAVIRNIGQFEQRGYATLKTWLFKIAINRTLNEIRKPKYREETVLEAGVLFDSGDVFASSPLGPEDALDRQEELRALVEALQWLDPKQKKALIMVENGQSYEEIGREIGLSTDATRSVIFRARKKIQKRRKGQQAELVMANAPVTKIGHDD